MSADAHLLNPLNPPTERELYKKQLEQLLQLGIRTPSLKQLINLNSLMGIFS